MILRIFQSITFSIALLVVSAVAEDDRYVCSRQFEVDASRKGIVSSPFYGEREKYPADMYCEYRLKAPKGYRIKITFKDLDISPSTSCSEDMLMISNHDRSVTYGTFCGYEIPFPIVSSKDENVVRLLFRTDDMGFGRGFSLEYESGPDLVLCEADHNECGNRNCYPKHKKCDGTDDCGDGTDEEECGFPIATNPEGCGIQAFEPKTIFRSPDRMVGGEIAVPHSWPWQVSLQSFNSELNAHFCGGTLINSQWVLTASHCVAGGTDPGDIRIHVGAHHKFSRSPYEQIRKNAFVIGYPDLLGEKIDHFSMLHDMSLIKLNAPVKFNEGVQPACLPYLGWTLQAGYPCYVTGWGETRGTGGSDDLKQMDQFIQSKNNCTYNEKTQICIEKKNNSPCHGDSGGPLQCKLGGKWYVFGVASYITPSNLLSGLCAGPGALSVYANVADKAEWIEKVIERFG